MNRLVGSGFREPIGAAWDRLTPRLQERLQHVHIFAGADPFLAGLTRGPESYTFADGQTISYRELAHCAYGMHQDHLATADRRTTIVLPTFRRYPDPVSTVAHELGHALHEVVGFEPTVVPVTSYARENRWEAFAEAFEAWVMDQPALDLLRQFDPATVVLFEALS